MNSLQFKKAVSLLRVSTDRQAVDDDIPSQRSLVNNFIEKQEMILVREFVEGGISGYKTKHEKRDALQTIKKMAENNEFEVLVVYKSDRIGRETTESPLAIKFLNDRGIRIFTIDGQELKTGTLTDELMTYLEFWRNKGESVKISERSVDYKKLAIQNGEYTGGSDKTIPFGYRVVDRGNKNKKGKNILDFEIDPENAELVKKIFNLSIQNNMGARAIAKWLNENGYNSVAKNNEFWSYRTITYMFNNPIYKGYFRAYFKSIDEYILSDKQDHLVIIPEHLWEKNQQIVKNRRKTISEKPKGTTSSRVLLSGLVYCGHCEEKMNLWANHKWYKKKNGEKTKWIQDKYKCYSALKYNGDNCDGQKTYSAKKIDSIVEKQTINTIKELSENQLNDNFKNELKNSLEEHIKNKKQLEKELEVKQKQIITLKKEIPLTMTNESKFSSEELKESLNLIQEDVNNLFKEIESHDDKINEQKTTIDEYDSLDKGIGTWEQRYNNADLIGRKALLNQIIDKVYVYRNEVAIEYKISLQEFKKESVSGSEKGSSGLPLEYKSQPEKVFFFTRRVKYNIAYNKL